MLGGKGAAARPEWFIPNSPAAPRSGLALFQPPLPYAPSSFKEPGAALCHFQGPLGPHPQGTQLHRVRWPQHPRRLGTRSGETCLHAKGGSHPRQNLCAPRRLAASQAAFPSQARGGGRGGQERPVASGFGSRRLRNLFFPQPGTARLSSRQPDPRSGVRIKDRH